MNWEEFKPKKYENPFATPEMPSYKEIPEEFKKFGSYNKWIVFFEDLFFCGIKKIEVTPKEGIDKDLALTHLSLWARSFDPKHEHKEAAFAYMASVWFDDIKYEKGKLNLTS